MGPGVNPVDGLAINIDEMKAQAVAAANLLNQPFNSLTARQFNMTPLSATNTATAHAPPATAGASDTNHKKQAIDNLIKLGIVINTIDVRSLEFLVRNKSTYARFSS